MLSFDYISIKSKIGVEFRRYALKREDVSAFDSFYRCIEIFHNLNAIPFVIFYLDSEDYLLPINNDSNLAKAVCSAKYISLRNLSFNLNKTQQYSPGSDYALISRPFLHLFLEKRDIFLNYYGGNLTGRFKKSHYLKTFSNLITSSNGNSASRPTIGMPEDFREVSSIIDVNIVPETCRRVRLVKPPASDKPLGFYIQDQEEKRLNTNGQIEIVTRIVISRLVPGGLAESTGLLGINDEILEVNGISIVEGKTLDQVTDMMIANSSNLIITIRPFQTNDQYC